MAKIDKTYLKCKNVLKQMVPGVGCRKFKKDVGGAVIDKC